MAFDPSVIAGISDRANMDPAGAQAKALTLADLYDTNQIRKGQLRAQATDQADMTYAKQILAGKDLSKLEDQNDAVAKITQRSPKLGMELMKGFQSQQAGKTDNDRAQLELHNAKNDLLGGSLTQLKLQHDDLIAKGLPEEQVDQQMREPMFQVIQQLAQAKLPNGQPLLNDEDRQFIQQNFAKGYNPQAVDSLVARSAQAKQAISQRLAERKDARAERDEDRKEKATNAAIAQGQARTASAEQGKIDGDDATFMAQQYLAGDKSIFTGLGRGAQGAQNIITVRRAIRSEAEKAGLKPADVAAKMAEYNGYVASQRSLGTRLAAIETASEEAVQMLDVAREASKNVPRGTWKPWNQLVKGENILTNDPAYAKLAAATLAVVNTWARSISPSGVPTVADKEHAHTVLNTVQSEEAYEAVLDQFKTEIDVALHAPESTKQRLHDAFIGKKTSPPGASAEAQAPPPAGGAKPGGAAPPPPPGFQLQ